jgi:hypothetical protein
MRIKNLDQHRSAPVCIHGARHYYLGMDAAGDEVIRGRVEQLLAAGFFGEQGPGLRVGGPIPVMDSSDHLHSWFVPLEIGPKLAGFAQLLPSLVPLRFSSFQRNPSDYENCPDLIDWTDRARILARAATLAHANEELSQPVLSYDRNPSRVAWRILAKSASGASRPLFVAGTAVYEAPAEPLATG